MSSLYNYFFRNYTKDDCDFSNIEPEKCDKKCIVTLKDLKSVKLRNNHEQIKPRYTIDKPVQKYLSKNGNLLLSTSQLTEILNIKLKPTIVNKKISYYPPRNPVIRELDNIFGANFS